LRNRGGEQISQRPAERREVRVVEQLLRHARDVLARRAVPARDASFCSLKRVRKIHVGCPSDRQVGRIASLRLALSHEKRARNAAR
jgi:hypothetical protein